MKLNTIKHKKIYFAISWTFMILSALIFFTAKLNYWIDMTWGTSAEYSYTWDINIPEARTNIEKASKEVTLSWSQIINWINIYKISWEKKLTVITWYETNVDAKTLDKVKNSFRAKTLDILKSENKSINETSYTNIGKSFWDYIKNTAILTLILAVVWITIYVAWAFSAVASGISTMSFSIITILTLFHDVLIATWLYIITSLYFPEFKIDTFFITALLTILGYSINDTIVVFDRIRWNLRTFAWKKWHNLEEIIETSIDETLRRSLFTSLTVIFVLTTIFLFWPESINWFILAMIFGTVVGTYSSIFIASPLLYEFNKSKDLSQYKEKTYNPDEKIVV